MLFEHARVEETDVSMRAVRGPMTVERADQTQAAWMWQQKWVDRHHLQVVGTTAERQTELAMSCKANLE